MPQESCDVNDAVGSLDGEIDVHSDEVLKRDLSLELSGCTAG